MKDIKNITVNYDNDDTKVVEKGLLLILVNLITMMRAMFALICVTSKVRICI